MIPSPNESSFGQSHVQFIRFFARNLKFGSILAVNCAVCLSVRLADAQTGMSQRGSKSMRSSTIVLEIASDRQTIQEAIGNYLRETGEAWGAPTTRLVGIETTHLARLSHRVRLVIFHADSEEHLQSLSFDCGVEETGSCSFSSVNPRCFYVSQARHYSPEEIFEAWWLNYQYVATLRFFEETSGIIPRGSAVVGVRVWQTLAGIGTRLWMTQTSRPDQIEVGVCKRSALRNPPALFGLTGVRFWEPISKGRPWVAQSPWSKGHLSCQHRSVSLDAEP
jgi:hypothetical protein